MLENNALEVMVLLYIVIYGSGFGFINTVNRIIFTIQNKPKNQNTTGVYLDMIWYTCLMYLWLWQPKFLDEVVARIVW